MQIVTLTTDWGYTDHYIGQVKGELYSAISDCQVVDITHNIRKFDIIQGAFVAKNACLNFPKGTIHIIDVTCNENSAKGYQHVVAKYNGQYFICTDNGLPSLIFDQEKPEKIIGITKVYQKSNYYTFSAYDLFCRVAALIAYDTDISDFGYEIKELVRKTQSKAAINRNGIQCCVFYIDSYGNVYLNITISEFLKEIDKKSFCLHVEQTDIKQISTSFDDVRENTPLLTVSSSGHLQIALNGESAAEMLGYTIGSQITIDII